MFQKVRFIGYWLHMVNRGEVVIVCNTDGVNCFVCLFVQMLCMLSIKSESAVTISFITVGSIDLGYVFVI